MKPRYWTKDNTLFELQNFISELGHFPVQKDFTAFRKNSLAIYVRKYGGMNYFRNLLGYPIIKRSNGEMQSFDKLKEIIMNTFPQMILNKTFPTTTMMYRAKMSSIVSAICKYHGGFASFAEKMECMPSGVFRTTDGHFVCSANEYEFDEFLYCYGIHHEYNKRICPDTKYRYDFKIEVNNKYYYIEIWGFDYNSNLIIKDNYQANRLIKEKLYDKLGFNLIGIEKNVFGKSQDNLESYFKELVISLGHSGERNLGNYVIDVSPRLYNEAMTANYLQQIIDTLGYFPNSTELSEDGKYSLVQAICKFGGINYWRKKFGFIPEKEHWTEEKILNKIQEIVDSIGSLPSARELHRMGENGLMVAMTRQGGVNYYRKLAGLPILFSRKKT